MTTTHSSNQTTGVSSRASAKSTRQAQLRKLLARKSGASIAQIQKAFGWQPHTARAAISAQRKSGSMIVRSNTDKGSVYRIVEEGGSQ
jgi:DNA-binding transcriptional regulator PaaX